MEPALKYHPLMFDVLTLAPDRGCGQCLVGIHIDGGVWHLDVGSSHPGAEVGPKGMAVRHLKWYASWV
uniref:Uncharacterized protein n=1 Tax=Panagrolaimus sp. JU765 TaxID=591449 RepID=A0AC34Q7H4_9BILA